MIRVKCKASNLAETVALATREWTEAERKDTHRQLDEMLRGRK